MINTPLVIGDVPARHLDGSPWRISKRLLLSGTGTNHQPSTGAQQAAGGRQAALALPSVAPEMVNLGEVGRI